MFCPKCNAEYRPGFTQCSDCHVALVDILPDENDQQSDAQLLSDDQGEVVTVYESGDPVQVGMAKALLDEAKIRYISGGEGLQDMFGVGRVGGMNLLVGPARIQVSTEDAARATEVLNELN